ARNTSEILGEHAEPADTRPRPDHEAESRDLVLAALAHVEIERRAVLLLHDLDGVDMPDIAESLGIPLNTGYPRLRGARQDFIDATERLTRIKDERWLTSRHASILASRRCSPQSALDLAHHKVPRSAFFIASQRRSRRLSQALGRAKARLGQRPRRQVPRRVP